MEKGSAICGLYGTDFRQDCGRERSCFVSLVRNLKLIRLRDDPRVISVSPGRCGKMYSRLCKCKPTNPLPVGGANVQRQLARVLLITVTCLLHHADCNRAGKFGSSNATRRAASSDRYQVHGIELHDTCHSRSRGKLVWISMVRWAETPTTLSSSDARFIRSQTSHWWSMHLTGAMGVWLTLAGVTETGITSYLVALVGCTNNQRQHCLPENTVLPFRSLPSF